MFNQQWLRQLKTGTSHTLKRPCFFCFSALASSDSWLLFLWLSPQSHTKASIILSITQPDGKKEGRVGGREGRKEEGRKEGRKEGSEDIDTRDIHDLIFYQK